MKYSLFTVTFLFLNNITFSQNFIPKDAGSKVHFVIKNFGIKTGGDFTGLKGNIVFNSKALSTCRFSITVNAATVDTDNKLRDSHLRKS